MNVSQILATIFLLFLAVIVESRVHPPFRRIQHPQILTRPPAGPSTSKSVQTIAAASTTTPPTTTTPEPPEVEEPEVEHASTRTGAYDPFSYFYDYDPLYGMDIFGSYGGFGGGVSLEVDDYVPSTTTKKPRGYRGRGYRGRLHQRPAANQPATTTTAKPTTEKPATPEPDDELLGNGSSGSTSASGAQSSSGYCFCSPLKACPNGSIQRGGYCWNFLSHFTNLLYRRCCYRPSVAKWF